MRVVGEDASAVAGCRDHRMARTLGRLLRMLLLRMERGLDREAVVMIQTLGAEGGVVFHQ
jgi:hypothetical protein